MRPLQQLIHSLGLFGVAGVGLLLFCAAFYLSAVKPAESEITAQRDAAQRLKSRSPQQPVSADNRGDDLHRFHSLFPPTEHISGELERLWVIASEYQIDLQQGEYRLESASPGLVRYRITLPLRASYAQLRQFVNFILKDIPTISIDGLRFERKKISETQLEAQIKLTLYFRPTATVAQP